MRDDRPAPTEEDLALDRALVQCVLQGQPGAFAQLVQRHQRLVGHLVQRLVRDPEDTRELCQEAFLRVHQRLHQWRGDSRLATWIGRVAWSLALRHLQRKRISWVELAPETSGDPYATAQDAANVAALEQLASHVVLEDDVARDQLHRLLHQAVDALPPLQRGLLTLYHFEEMPIAEIARISGLPEGTIKSHLYRSRQVLRQQLAHAMGIRGHERQR